MKSVQLSKPCDMSFTILLVQRPNALQVILVDCAMPDVGSLRFQLAPDLLGECFHSIRKRAIISLHRAVLVNAF
jgi:hypothetical protein